MECEAGRLHQCRRLPCELSAFFAEHGGPDLGVLVTILANPWRPWYGFDIGDVVRLDGHTPCPSARRED